MATPSKTPAQSISRSSSRSTGRFNPTRQSSFSLTPSKKTPSRDIEGDRFIPSRRHMNMNLFRQAMKSGEKRVREEDPNSGSPSRQSRHIQETPIQKEFKRRMLSSMCNIPLDKLNEDCEPTSILSFGGSSQKISNFENKPPVVSDPFSLDFLRTMKIGGADQDPATQQSVANKVIRKVASAPIRILDAPDIVDDYYLNLVSWSKE